MKRIFILYVIFILTSCKTQYFIIEDIDTDQGDDSYIIQTIIISNPPRNQEKLFEIVEEYNKQTISYEEVMKYKMIRRKFYRETIFLTRKWEEGKPYPTLTGEFIYGPEQLIIHHSDARLLNTNNYKNIKGQPYFDISINTKLVFRRKIDNPEEYYLK